MLADASSQCRRTRDTRVLQSWVQCPPPLSICGSWLSVRAPLSSWQLWWSSWPPPSDCRCRPSRRLSRSSGTRWRAPVTKVGVAVPEICIGWSSASPMLLLFCWFIWRTAGLWQMPNNHARSDVAQIATVSPILPISNILAVIYHIIKEGRGGWWFY